MGVKIWIPVVILAIIAGTVLFLFIWGTRETKHAKRERKFQELADDANLIFRELFIVTDINNINVLTNVAKERINGWDEKYRKVYK